MKQSVTLLCGSLVLVMNMIFTLKIRRDLQEVFSEHEDMLHAFISDILEIPFDSIRKIEIRNPEMPLRPKRENSADWIWF